jgi:hypothetical protein
MNTGSKTGIVKNNKMLIVMVVAVGLFLLLAFCAALKLQQYDRSLSMSEASAIRELIIHASQGTKKAAPIDPKTGDVYFPEAKLYLPHNPALGQLSYAYNLDTNQLSISTREVFGQAAAQLYSATSVDEVFAAVPKLQSCQRGITLVYNQINAEENQIELKQTIEFADGGILYVYQEPLCPELEETAKSIGNLRTY